MKKRIKTRVKGRNAEIELKNLMEEAGWTVLLTPPPKKYNKENDFFNLYDLMCYKGMYRKYIQVKCNRKVYGKNLKRYVDWGKKFCNEYESVEVWVRKDGLRERERWDPHVVWTLEE